MSRKIKHILGALSLSLAPILVTPLTALSQDAGAVSALKQAVAQARANNWSDAISDAQAGGPLVRDLLEWHRLRRGEGSFEDSRAFLAKHPDWPGLKYLRKQSEETIPHRYEPSKVLEFFKPEPPQTGRGALRLAEAHAATQTAAASH